MLPIALRSLARFDPADHGAGDAPTLRQDIESFLATHGIDIDGGPISLLTHARVFGHVFNPLSVYWCRYADGTPACVVAEVHNTYGGRHRYLLRPDSTGVASADKEFFVSPFNAVDGSYRMWLPEPGRRLSLAVTLDRTDRGPFTADDAGRAAGG